MEDTSSPSACEVEGCDKPKFCRGMCSMHYARWQRHGNPNKTVRQSPQVDVEHKRCPRCGITKPIADYRTRPNGRPAGYCRECDRQYDASYAKSDVGREARRMARDRWNTDNHDYFLQYRYGITRADYDRMLEEQGHRCAICGDTEPGGNFTLWPVDHCHATNRVRGLLCHRCNMGLGYFKDDPERLRAAIKYLL